MSSEVPLNEGSLEFYLGFYSRASTVSVVMKSWIALSGTITQSKRYGILLLTHLTNSVDLAMNDLWYE